MSTILRFTCLLNLLLEYDMIESQEEPALAKITRDSTKITVEQVHGLMSQVYNYSNALYRFCWSQLLYESFKWLQVWLYEFQLMMLSSLLRLSKTSYSILSDQINLRQSHQSLNLWLRHKWSRLLMQANTWRAFAANSFLSNILAVNLWLIFEYL